MLPYLTHVHLEPPVTPLHDEVRVDLDCEVAVVDLQDLKVVQPDLHLGKVFLKIVQPDLHLGKVFGKWKKRMAAPLKVGSQVG